MEYQEMLEDLQSESVDAKILPANNLHYTRDNTLAFAKKEKPLTRNAWEQFLSRVKIPSKYMDRAPNDLREYNVNYWLKDIEDDYQVVYDEDNVIGIMEPNVILVPAFPIIDMIGGMLESPKVGCYQNDEYIYNIELFTEQEDTQQEVRKGDILKGGLSILYSPLRKVSNHINALVHRVICSNGMVYPERGRRFRFAGKDFSEILDTVREAAEQTIMTLGSRVELLAESSNHAVEDVQEVMRKIFKEYDIPAKYFNQVSEKVEEGTMYGVMNALTSAANDVESIVDRKLLQAAAGNTATSEMNRCGRCGHLLR